MLTSRDEFVFLHSAFVALSLAMMAIIASAPGFGDSSRIAPAGQGAASIGTPTSDADYRPYLLAGFRLALVGLAMNGLLLYVGQSRHTSFSMLYEHPLDLHDVPTKRSRRTVRRLIWGFCSKLCFTAYLLGASLFQILRLIAMTTSVFAIGCYANAIDPSMKDFITTLGVIFMQALFVIFVAAFILNRLGRLLRPNRRLFVRYYVGALKRRRNAVSADRSATEASRSNTVANSTAGTLRTSDATKTPPRKRRRKRRR